MTGENKFKWLGGKYHQKGGEDSGHHGHAGIPGQVGGSLPGSVKPLVEMMTLYEKEKELKENLKWCKSLERRAHTAFIKDRSDRNQEKEGRARREVVEAEEKVKANKDALKAYSKTKAPGFGEWQEDGEKSKAATTPWGKVRIYTHPEFGEVERRIAKGARRQGIPDTASVKFTFPGAKSLSKEWSGASAADQAQKFINKYWGVGIF